MPHAEKVAPVLVHKEYDPEEVWWQVRWQYDGSMVAGTTAGTMAVWWQIRYGSMISLDYKSIQPGMAAQPLRTR